MYLLLNVAVAVTFASYSQSILPAGNCVPIYRCNINKKHFPHQAYTKFGLY